VIEAENLSLEIEPRKVINQVIVGNGNPDVTPVNATATNDNSGSPSSTVFTATRTAVYQVDVPDSTTATNLAAQLLADHTAALAKRIRFGTLPRPIHDDRDRYDITIPEIGINTAQGFVGEEWSLPLDGSTMKHSMLAVADVS
jgi:hypothetical protein